ncbi:hypothetical protein OG930_21440 [Streptomyces sp. NBC_01799]|nr:hypothetical protein [Streptomyces sp. NBC_01800]WSA69458.1 hypothetical protein OIE65_22160 [Streptomyces sp. NBC_01800]WSA77943.1 hypothetical protein OG930_21440 [Streptomyces sp. NBC_01799]
MIRHSAPPSAAVCSPHGSCTDPAKWATDYWTPELRDGADGF